MNLHEAALFAAHYLKRSIGRDVAVLLEASGAVGGWAREWRVRAASSRTPAVVAMQGLATRGFQPADYFLYTTYAPTDACVAMGLRCHVTHVIYYDPGARALRFRDPRNVTAPAAPLTGALTGMSGAVWEADPSAGYSAGHFLEALAAGRAMPRLDADYMAHIDQGMDAALLLKEFDPEPAAHPLFPLPSVGAGGMTPLQQNIYMAATLAMLDLRRGLQIGQGQTIAALLVGPNGDILSFGINTNADNITRHAEVNCLQSYEDDTGAAVPNGAFLFSTLRSCEMCSALITTMAQGITVFYAEPDPGVQGTTLSTGVNASVEHRSNRALSTNASLRWMGLRSVRSLLPGLGVRGRNHLAVDAYRPTIKLVKKPITLKLANPMMYERFAKEFEALVRLGDQAAAGSDAEAQTWVHCTDFVSELMRRYQ
jgi:tRNA(Arg) A34 adenosine deaminase TadA